MGCTSSVPNTAELQTNTSDNLENNIISDGTEDQSRKPREMNSNGHQESEQKHVLPECEAISKQTNIDRYHSDTPSDKHISEMDNKDIQEKETDDNTINNTEFTQLNKNFSSLKDVVDKVLYENNEDEQKSNDGEAVQDSDVDRQIAEIIKETSDSDGVIEKEHNDDKTNELTSPTQSEDSRATRWEALADIAAELPPSLAVDPLTGQIYSLAK